jgi:hypothetical protein
MCWHLAVIQPGGAGVDDKAVMPRVPASIGSVWQGHISHDTAIADQVLLPFSLSRLGSACAVT